MAKILQKADPCGGSRSTGPAGSATSKLSVFRKTAAFTAVYMSNSSMIHIANPEALPGNENGDAYALATPVCWTVSAGVFIYRSRKQTIKAPQSPSSAAGPGGRAGSGSPGPGRPAQVGRLRPRAEPGAAEAGSGIPESRDRENPGEAPGAAPAQRHAKDYNSHRAMGQPEPRQAYHSQHAPGARKGFVGVAPRSANWEL